MIKNSGGARNNCRQLAHGAPGCSWAGAAQAKPAQAPRWVSALVRDGKARRIALIGPTFHDVREVMVEGPSGLRSLPHRAPAL